MMIKWVKRLIRVIFAALIWQEAGFLLAIVYFVICIPIDFFALVLVDKLAIKGYQKGRSEDARREAIDELRKYQKVKDYPGLPLVTFAQMILGPALSISIPIIIGAAFLGWFFHV